MKKNYYATTTLYLITTIFFSPSLFALTCKQSESIPLAKVHEQTTQLSTQFTDINHIEVLPEKVTPGKEGFTVETVQVLICGDVIPTNPGAITTPGLTCQFDSHCASPMRCQNEQCTVPQ